MMYLNSSGLFWEFSTGVVEIFVRVTITTISTIASS
jgi:hypothetical protein